jgi:L-rhamnose mutarotase
VWPEVIAHIRSTGVTDMEIWCMGNRLIMIMTVAEDFPRDVPEPSRVTDWEKLMDSFQQRFPGAPADEKWTAMTRIFALEESGTSWCP